MTSQRTASAFALTISTGSRIHKVFPQFAVSRLLKHKDWGNNTI
jgi:hypothetical protein